MQAMRDRVGITPPTCKDERPSRRIHVARDAGDHETRRYLRWVFGTGMARHRLPPA
jgi:hypothetical protein